MKLTHLLPFLALAGLGRAATVDTAKVPVSDFLYAIRQVETGNNYNAPVGRFGEIGAYQFRREVWYQHTHAPFSQARTTYADEIASIHYNWIAAKLRAAGLPASPYNIAAAWNGGVVSVSSGRIPRTTRDYAARVVNIVRDEANLRRSLTPHYTILPPQGDIPVLALR